MRSRVFVAVLWVQSRLLNVPTFGCPDTPVNLVSSVRRCNNLDEKLIASMRKSACGTHTSLAPRRPALPRPHAAVVYTSSPPPTPSARAYHTATLHCSKAVKPDVHLASISGGTDILGCFALGNPTLPVRAGHLQCLGLGMDVCAYRTGQDEGDGSAKVGSGRSAAAASSRVAARGEMGELVCRYFLAGERGRGVLRHCSRVGVAVRDAWFSMCEGYV